GPRGRGSRGPARATPRRGVGAPRAERRSARRLLHALLPAPSPPARELARRARGADERRGLAERRARAAPASRFAGWQLRPTDRAAGSAARVRAPPRETPRRAGGRAVG